jgi:hypothetical protein
VSAALTGTQNSVYLTILPPLLFVPNRYELFVFRISFFFVDFILGEISFPFFSDLFSPTTFVFPESYTHCSLLFAAHTVGDPVRTRRCAFRARSENV